MAQGTRHAVIVSHPSPDSFTLSVAQRYATTAKELGDDVVIRDLYRLNFDPILKAEEQPGHAARTLSEDVRAELDILSGSHVFVIVFPIWFGGPPAMLKGYIDRVLGAGVTHADVQGRQGHSLTQGKRLVSFTSSGNSRNWFEDQGAWMSWRNIFDTYLTNAFAMAGNDHYHFDRVTQGMKEETVRSYLREVEDAARATCAKFKGGKPSQEYPLRM